MPNTIKVKRGKSAALNSSTEKLQAGEVLYNLDKNYLTVGAKDNDALTKKPVAAREIVGYVGDTDSKVGASTTEAYSIRYNDDSGVVVSSENNILSTPGTLKMQTPGKNASTITINTGEVDSDGSAKPTIELSTSLSMPVTLALPWKTGTLATTDDITTSITTKLDNTNEDKVALKNNKSLSYTSNATASTIMSRDANGRAKVADGAADQDIATVGQLNTGLNAKVTKPANPTADSVLSILKDGSIGSIPQIKYITLTGTSGTLTADQISTLNENIKYNFIIKETRQAGGYTQSKIFRPIQVYSELDEDVDFVYAHIELDISELIGISGNSWYYSSWKLSKDKVVEISSTDADSGTLTTQQNNDLLDRRTLLLLHGEYYYFIGDLTHAETKIFHSYVSYGKSANDSLQIKIVTIDENASPNTWVRTTYDLGNYYTKTESDSRYVHSTTELYQVYIHDDEKDAIASYAYIPKAGAFPRYDTNSQLQSAAPTEDLDVVNMKYGEGNYYQLDKGIYLTENADLNNYKTPGTYKANPQVAGTVANTPKGSSFFTLFVSTNPGTEVITQLLYSYSHIFTRSYAVSWSDWEELATTDYIDNGFVKQTTGHNKVYATDSTGTDSELGYSQSPANSTITQYSSSGTLRTNNPTANLDAVNKQYLEANAVLQKIYYTSDNKVIDSAVLATLRPGFYIIPAEYDVKISDDDILPSDYYTLIKQGGSGAIPYNDSTYLFISYNGLIFSYAQYGTSGYENKATIKQFATTSYVDNKTADLSNKYDKTGGTITGDVVVTGNFTVNGTTTTIDSTTLKVKDKLIEVGSGNTVALTTPAGLITPKYDGTNNGGLVYDSTGTAFVGDIVLNTNGDVDVAQSDLQPIATRNDYSAYTTDHIITASVDSTGKSVKFVDSGKTLTDITSKVFSVTIYEAGD